MTPTGKGRLYWKVNHGLLRKIKSKGAILLSDKEVAPIFNVKPQTIAKWRRKNTGPFCEMNGRSVRYKLSEIEEFIETLRIWA